MSKKVNLSYSETEWDKINHEAGSNGLAAFINRKIKSLETKGQVCPVCVDELTCQVKAKSIDLNEDAIRILESFKRKTGKPISTIVSRLIIDPLLYK